MASKMKFLLLAVVIVAMWSSTAARLSDYCVRCICEQSSDCSCSGDEGCGPFNIESSFMSAASDRDTGRKSYAQCKADVGCSRRVFEAYVDSYVPRKGGRRTSQCELASRIYTGGALGPNSRSSDGFWLMVQSCMINE